MEGWMNSLMDGQLGGWMGERLSDRMDRQVGG